MTMPLSLCLEGLQSAAEVGCLASQWDWVTVAGQRRTCTGFAFQPSHPGVGAPQSFTNIRLSSVFYQKSNPAAVAPPGGSELPRESSSRKHLSHHLHGLHAVPGKVRLLSGAYFPCQDGLRFSRNACIPSFWSSVAKRKVNARRSWRMPSSRNES